jgi:hypothetical protein
MNGGGSELTGERRFSLMRASSTANRQSILVAVRLRSSSQAATSAVSVSMSGMRWSRHWVDSTAISTSAISNREPWVGV